MTPARAFLAGAAGALAATVVLLGVATGDPARVDPRPANEHQDTAAPVSPQATRDARHFEVCRHGAHPVPRASDFSIREVDAFLATDGTAATWHLINTGHRWGRGGPTGTPRWQSGCLTRELRLAYPAGPWSGPGLLVDDRWTPVAVIDRPVSPIDLPDGFTGWVMLPGCAPARARVDAGETTLVIALHREATVAGIVDRPGLELELESAVAGAAFNVGRQADGRFEALPLPAAGLTLRLCDRQEVVVEHAVDLQPGPNDLGRIMAGDGQRVVLQMHPRTAVTRGTLVHVQFNLGGFAAADRRQPWWPVRSLPCDGDTVVVGRAPWGEVTGYAWTDSGWFGSFTGSRTTPRSAAQTVKCVLDPPTELRVVFSPVGATAGPVTLVAFDDRIESPPTGFAADAGWRAGSSTTLLGAEPGSISRSIPSIPLALGVVNEIGMLLGRTAVRPAPGGVTEVRYAPSLRRARIVNLRDSEQAAVIAATDRTSSVVLRVPASSRVDLTLDDATYEVRRQVHAATSVVAGSPVGGVEVFRLD